MGTSSYPKHHVLYALPRRFYWESSTSMGSLYTGSRDRWDWGDVESALESGDSVQIEPAPAWLTTWAETELAAIKLAMGRHVDHSRG